MSSEKKIIAVVGVTGKQVSILNLRTTKPISLTEPRAVQSQEPFYRNQGGTSEA
jgi:hypothetical protein